MVNRVLSKIYTADGKLEGLTFLTEEMFNFFHAKMSFTDNTLTFP